MDEETEKQIEAECEKTKKDATCAELLSRIPPDELELELQPKKVVEESLEVKATKKVNFMKSCLRKIFEPRKVERHENIFKFCTTDEPPCNLECLYGHKLEDEEEKIDDVVKERIYTKQGAIYDTIAYRLPDDFAVGPVPATKEEKLAAEKAAQLATQPWYEDKAKKKKKKKKKPEMLEFSGPVKIIIVDKEGFLTSYTAKRIHAAFIQFSYMFIGATIIFIYFYTLQFNSHYSSNLHIICCTIAFQFCLPASLLVRNKQCVAGYVMSTKHTFQHSLILKTLGIINIVGCAYILYLWKPVLPMSIFTKHALLGYAACSFALAEYILNILVALALGHDRGFIVDCYIHFLTVAAIVTAFYSFAIAITEHKLLKNFVNYTDWYYWIIATIGIFILSAIFRTSMDCLFHMWNYLCAVVMWLFYLVRPHDPCTVRVKDTENPFNLINNPDQKQVGY